MVHIIILVNVIALSNLIGWLGLLIIHPFGCVGEDLEHHRGDYKDNLAGRHFVLVFKMSNLKLKIKINKMNSRNQINFNDSYDINTEYTLTPNPLR